MTSTIKTEFGLESKINHGLKRQVDEMTPIHPIEASERNFAHNQEKAWCDQLKKMQGLHAPLNIMIEKKTIANNGHFACISTRSNLDMDVLQGKDDTIGFEDFLGRPEHYEGFAQPHEVIEKTLATRKGM